MMNESTTVSPSPGDRLAKIFATSIASIIGAALLAIGTTVVNNAVVVSKLMERCDSTKEHITELDRELSLYPPAQDLLSIRDRLGVLERTADVHSLFIEAVKTRPDARHDSFTGTQGKEVNKRVDATEDLLYRILQRLEREGIKMGNGK